MFLLYFSFFIKNIFLFSTNIYYGNLHGVFVCLYLCLCAGVSVCIWLGRYGMGLCLCLCFSVSWGVICRQKKVSGVLCRFLGCKGCDLSKWACGGDGSSDMLLKQRLAYSA